MSRAGLRGRGGAGFPTGTKWTSVRSQPASRRYAVCNGAEGEPGTFKDRALLRANPYQVVEGLLDRRVRGRRRARVPRAQGELRGGARACATRAIVEMQDAGICRDCELVVVAGPEEYLYGEEKALLEVIEGNPPWPCVLPPYQHGLFATTPQLGWSSVAPADGARPDGDGSNPTLVNNVETLANVPHILVRGVEWFRGHGTEQTPGNVVCTVVGDVVHAGVDEVEPGTSLREVITTVGGGPRPRPHDQGGVLRRHQSGDPRPGARCRAVVRGRRIGGQRHGRVRLHRVRRHDLHGRGRRGVSRFLFVESCGQCPPCKLGSGEITQRLDDLQDGIATERMVEEIWEWLGKVTDGSRCFLATEEAQLVGSIVEQFSVEVEEHLVGDGCPRPRHLVIPKLVDVRDGNAVYDERQPRKAPDWTYA